jgi:WD40 repeat protein
MLSKKIWPITILATVATLLTVPQQLRAMSPYEVAEIAKEITVIIRGPGSPGSGTIIGRKGNTYFVLTAAHVVNNISPTEEADVEAYNKRLYPINTRKITLVPDVDLAILEFTSKEEFKVIEIGNSENLRALASIYVAGYPLEGQAMRGNFNITQGTVSSLDTFNNSGYDLVYTNVTREGMSGGPILNENGQLIGIHGRAEGTIFEGNAIKAGFNLGIPINVFLTKLPRLGMGLEKFIVLKNQEQSESSNTNTVNAPTQVTQVTISSPPPVNPSTNTNLITFAPAPDTRVMQYLDKFIADDGNSGDVFGKAVAMRGDYILVGAPYSDANGKVDSGAAYIFNLGKQTLRKLVADDGMAGNLFGYSVAIDGQYGIIGSPYNDRKGTDSGLAYIFDLNTGQQLRRFAPDDNLAGDLFGYAVAVSGKYAVVGSPYADFIGLDSGSAYLFDITSGKQLQKFVPAGGAAGDLFGHTVAIDGKYALIASPYQDLKGVDSGAVYLFDVTTGQQINKLIPNDGSAGDVFGYSLALKGKYALISAVYSNAKGTNSGAVYLFDVSNGQQIRKFTAEDGAPGNRFGSSVAFNNQYIIIGSAYNDARGVHSGAVYLFDVSTGQQIRKLVPDDGGAGDLFGYAVTIDGQRALIGSAYDDHNNKVDNGSVYLFDLNTGLQIKQ